MSGLKLKFVEHFAIAFLCLHFFLPFHVGISQSLIFNKNGSENCEFPLLIKDFNDFPRCIGLENVLHRNKINLKQQSSCKEKTNPFYYSEVTAINSIRCYKIDIWDQQAVWGFQSSILPSRVHHQRLSSRKSTGLGCWQKKVQKSVAINVHLLRMLWLLRHGSGRAAKTTRQ